MFDTNSRYLGTPTYTVTDHRGRTVTVVQTPPDPGEGLLGIHVLKQGERLDHLAFKYLNDPAGYWRIAERNEAMLPEQLTEQREIEIPGQGS
ncbi:MAG TPA: hypothetical protein VHZ74_04705 [Bryobacteraceae bacterium]|nr:hypothetical protein [Bryobacteraceae bacterium]